jgi:hypothetical protein
VSGRQPREAPASVKPRSQHISGQMPTLCSALRCSKLANDEHFHAACRYSLTSLSSSLPP